jgi:hypothetical protein
MRLHEEWLTIMVERLGIVATHMTDLGDGPHLRQAITNVEELARHWSRWAETKDPDERLAIEQEAGL